MVYLEKVFNMWEQECVPLWIINDPEGCDIFLTEVLELEAFPYDVQDQFFDN